MPLYRKDNRGCLIYSTRPSIDDEAELSDLRDITEDAPQDLDLDAIMRTVSSIRDWLASSPPLTEALEVFEYEKSDSNRISAVGEEGCLTLYLQGE